MLVQSKTVEECFDYMKPNKDSLWNIMRIMELSNNKLISNVLKDAAIRTNQIVKVTNNFIRGIYFIFISEPYRTSLDKYTIRQNSDESCYC